MVKHNGKIKMFQTTNQYNVIICLIPKLCIFFVGRPPIYVRMVQIWKAKTARFAIKCVVSHLETNIWRVVVLFIVVFFFKASTAVFTALAQDSTDLNLFCCLVGYVWPPQDEGSNQLRHL
jgi:hypothetical protein